MSQKKCPKCGELNPPEAVMCWACYTPLSGSAPASGPAPGPVVGASGGVAKAAIPPWQMGVLGVGFVVALGFGAKTMFGGSGEDEDEDVTAAVTQADPGEQPAAAPAPAAVPPPPPVPVSNPPAEAAVPAPDPKPTYSIVSIPNATYNWGTMAIVLANESATTRQAAAIAASVRQKMMRNKKWRILHIYVFADREAAAQFKKYQDTRKGAPLGPDDLRALGSAWEAAPVRYEYNRGSEGILLPSRNPSRWWNAKTIYTKVKQ